ncbi:DNA glycosylase AlkZ-like family protein [Streptomyces stramineus]
MRPARGAVPGGGGAGAVRGRDAGEAAVHAAHPLRRELGARPVRQLLHRPGRRGPRAGPVPEVPAGGRRQRLGRAAARPHRARGPGRPGRARRGDDGRAGRGRARPAGDDRGVPRQAVRRAAERRQRLLRLLASDGHVRRSRPRGSWTSSMYAWAPVPQLPEIPVREAKAELARRWLAAFGPATEADLKWWTGWTLGDTRKALADVGAVDVELTEGTGFVLPGDLPGDLSGGPEGGEEGPAGPWAALLPGLDPTAMGWRGRDWYLSPDQVPALFDRAGNIGPTVWWDGRIVGGWAQRADGGIVWRPLVDTGREAAAAIEEEAARLAAWLGPIRVTPRFRTPLERELVR